MSQPPGAYPRPLEGVTVTDLTIVVAGPVATGVLADLGAEVIKIENVVARNNVAEALPKAPHVQEDRPYNRNNMLNDLNRSKKAVTLNFAVPEAKEVFRRLVAVSDVVVENFSPRVMGNFGFGYDALKGIRSDIIMVSLPGFGSTGPMRNRTAFGPGIEAVTGLGDLTGFPDGPPLKPGNFVTDYSAGMMAAFAVMLALHYRRRTGTGQHIELAMREGALQFIGEQFMDYAMNRREQTRMGNRHPSKAPHNVYPCKGEDEWIAIAVGSDQEWERLCGVMGRPAWAQDARYRTVLGRLQHEDELEQRLAGWTREHDHFALMRTLQEAGVDAGAVATTKEIAHDPHYRERGFIQTVDHPEIGPTRYTRHGFKLGKTPGFIGPAPGFGQHNSYVLQELLGMSPEEVQGLAAKGAIAWAPVSK